MAGIAEHLVRFGITSHHLQASAGAPVGKEFLATLTSAGRGGILMDPGHPNWDLGAT